MRCPQRFCQRGIGQDQGGGLGSRTIGQHRLDDLRRAVHWGRSGGIKAKRDPLCRYSVQRIDQMRDRNRPRRRA